MNNFKKFTALLLALVMSLALVACGGGEEETAENKNETSQTEENKTEESGELSEEEAWKQEPAYGQTVQFMMGDGCTAGPMAALELGYFEELGIKAEGVKADSDVEALGTNAVDLAVGHIAKQLVPATNGVDLVFVAGAHSGCKSIFVAADSPYQTLEDLKGLKISTPNGIGKSDYNITARLFDADGIDPLKEVELVQVETSACVPAMQNGEIAAALLSDSFAYHMVKDGQLRMIRSMLDEDLGQICCAVTMNGTFVKENPITAKKMAQAVRKAHEWMAANPEEATKFLIEKGLNSDDLEMNIELNDSYMFGPTNEFTASQLREIMDDYKRIGLCTTTEDTDVLMEQLWIPLTEDK